MFQFERFASEYRIPTFAGRGDKFHVRDGWIGAKCPQCGSQHLGFNTDRGYFSCWMCGILRIVDVIQWLTNASKDKAWEIRWKFDSEQRRVRIATGARPRSLQAPPGLEVLSDRHLRYLRTQRGLERPRAVAREWDLMGTGHLSGKWSWRVVGPIRNDKGGIVAYVGRSIMKLKAKYQMTDRSKCLEDPNGLLYGIHKAKGDSVIIVEGPGDVWKLGPGAVATLGKNWRRLQANRLRQFKRRFVMYDPDPEAQQKAQELAEWLSMYPGETEVVDGLPSDPGSLSEKMVRKIRRELLGEHHA